MERIYRILLLAIFIVGFLGAIASADRNEGSLVDMIKDVKLAQEINDINGNKWNQDVADINEDGLARVEKFLSQGDENH